MVTKESKILVTVNKIFGREQAKSILSLIEERYKVESEQKTYRCSQMTIDLSQHQKMFVQEETKSRLNLCKTKEDFIALKTTLRVYLMQSFLEEMGDILATSGYDINIDYVISVLE